MASTNSLGDMEFLLSRVAYSAAPTILDKKPSTLMSFSQGSRNLYLLWERHKTNVSTLLGLDYVELSNRGMSRLVLFYKHNLLLCHLGEHETAQFLVDMGYPKEMGVDQYLEKLRVGFLSMCPNEVGVFLGIPLADVKTYIKCDGQGALACRYWKVYHNLEEAERTFALYDEARQTIVRSLSFMPSIASSA